MDKKNKSILKIYPLPYSDVVVTLYGLMSIGIACLMWVNVAIGFLLIVTLIGFAYHLFFCKALYISQDGVREKRKMYSWENIDIVIYPIKFFISKGELACIVFCEKGNIDNQFISEQIKKKLYARMSLKVLDEILKYYDRKLIIKSVQRANGTTFGYMTKKCSGKLEAHNAQYID